MYLDERDGKDAFVSEFQRTQDSCRYAGLIVIFIGCVAESAREELQRLGIL